MAQRHDEKSLLLEAGAAETRVRALDGYELGAAYYDARAAAPRRVVVLHSGAGIPAVRYRRFARFLADAGIPVLTYDYRGIGLSRPAELRGFRATGEDWAEYDTGGAVAWMRERFPQAELIGVAHSIGALLLGAAPNAGEQSRLVLIGAHTGYYGDYRLLYRLPMAVVWHALMPALTKMFGYFPARRLGLGEDIPAGLALQWGARRAPELQSISVDPAAERRQALLERCRALQRPATVVSISDDAFATVASVKRLLTYYPRLQPLRYITYTPADAATRRIGHYGFFRRAPGAALWPLLLAQLDEKPR